MKLKKIISVILVFCLINLQTAYAQTTNTPTNSSYSESHETSTDQLAHEGKAAIAFNVISLIITTMTAPVYLINCPKKPSAWIFAATSVAYFVSEMVNWAKYKEYSDKQLEIIDNTQKDLQIETMSTAAKETRSASDAARNKAIFAGAVTGGFLAASITAIIEGLRPDDPGGVCTGGAAYNKTDNSKNLYYASNSNDFEKYLQSEKVLKTDTFVASLKSSTSNTDSYFIFDEWTRLKRGEIKSASIKEYDRYNNSIKKFSISDIKFNETFTALLKTLNNVIFPPVYATDDDDNAGGDLVKLDAVGIKAGAAGGGAAIGIAAGIISAAIIKAKLKAQMDKISSRTSGIIRSVVFGANAAISTVVMGLNTDISIKLGKRADQYQELVDRLTEVLSTNVNTNLNSNVIKQNIVPIQEASSMNVTQANGSCYTGAGTTLVSDPECNCKKSNSCKQAQIPSIGFKGFQSPTLMSSSLDNLKNMSNALYNGDTSSALASGSALSQNAANLRKYKKALEGQYNKIQKKNGKKEFPFNKATKHFKNNAIANVKKLLSTMSDSDKGTLMNALADNNFGSPELKPDKVKKGISSEEESNIAKQNVISTSGSKKASDFNFSFVDDKKESDKSESEVAANSTGFEYNENRNDISDRKEDSIFNIISTRYLKSAYDVFFDEDNSKK